MTRSILFGELDSETTPPSLPPPSPPQTINDVALHFTNPAQESIVNDRGPYPSSPSLGIGGFVATFQTTSKTFYLPPSIPIDNLRLFSVSGKSIGLILRLWSNITNERIIFLRKPTKIDLKTQRDICFRFISFDIM